MPHSMLVRARVLAQGGYRGLAVSNQALFSSPGATGLHARIKADAKVLPTFAICARRAVQASESGRLREKSVTC